MYGGWKLQQTYGGVGVKNDGLGCSRHGQFVELSLFFWRGKGEDNDGERLTYMHMSRRVQRRMMKGN